MDGGTIRFREMKRRRKLDWQEVDGQRSGELQVYGEESGIT